MICCRGSCRSGFRGWRRIVRVWILVLNGGMINCMLEVVLGFGIFCCLVRGRRYFWFLVYILCICFKRLIFWRIGQLLKRLGQLCFFRRENWMDFDFVVYSQGDFQSSWYCIQDFCFFFVDRWIYRFFRVCLVRFLWCCWVFLFYLVLVWIFFLFFLRFVQLWLWS